MSTYRYQSVNNLTVDNSVEDFLTASKLLIRFATNIIDNPTEEKYRKIRLSNPTVQSKLLNISGGMECLFEMGFEEDGEFLTLRQGSSTSAMRQIVSDLEKERKKHESVDSQSPRPPPALAPPAIRSQQTTTTTPARSSQSFSVTEAEFLSRLHGAMSKVMSYENLSSQQKARTVMPVEELTKSAQEKFEANKNNPSDGKSSPYDLKDYLLLALLRWFKVSFFKWVDTLPCSFCNSKTTNAGGLASSQDDIRYGAGRVEAHSCTNCKKITRFPRYGSAEKLLETRRGRCGEWADCFTLCCRALGFEARYVLDWTDHVWTEVFSRSQDRWLHCDPCENVMDKPLLYEAGWGKKLSYIVAFAKDDVRDVSWRYSAKHKELLTRRVLCRETWLSKTIHGLRFKKMSNLTDLKKNELNLRLIKEVVTFLSVKMKESLESGGQALPGRSTGSEDWRRARGELGNQAHHLSTDNDTTRSTTRSFTFTPTQQEQDNGMMHVCYSIVKDAYIRSSSTNEHTSTSSWQSCVAKAVAVTRKEEFDWKMVYLARDEGSNRSEICWKFATTGTGLVLDKMELKAETYLCEGASIQWRVCADDNCFMETGSSLQHSKMFDLQGAKTVSITAVLQGGEGENAWQHSQLFRRSMTENESASSYPFEVKLFLR